jgi:iron complex transport system substrate-binding protein
MTSSHTARRIACLQPSATVILDSIGELERVVACTRYCADVVPEVADGSRIILADSWTADTAQIVAAQPDLVIAAVPYQEKAVSEILKAGARFLGLAPKTLADIYTASQKWVAELVEAAGGDFVGTPGRQAASQEVQRLNPEVIVAAWCGAGDRVPLEKIILERGWQRTAAALSARVFCIRDEFLNTPAPTLLHGLRALAFAIHPELFPCVKGIRQIIAVAASAAENATR